MELKVADAVFALLRTVLRDDCDLSGDDKQIIKDNIREIYETSKRNDMAHLVGYALEKQDLISQGTEAFARFQKQQYLAIYRCEGMEFEIGRMREAFEREHIDFIMLKGAVIRDLYPEGWMRTSSDIDILIHPTDMDAAERLFMDELGYEKGVESTHDRSFHTAGGVHIELHYTLLEDERANSASDVLGEAWEHATPAKGKKHEYELSDAMFYFYHIAHIAKHIEYAGVGARPFIDLWLINKSPNKKTEERQTLLSRGSLDTFSAVCDELADYWLGDRKTLSEIGKKFEIFILNCGIYGSEENRIAIFRNDGGGTAGYIFKRLFMPYSSLKQAYPIIERHKWLTPFYQMARWFKLITGEKTKKAINEVKISTSTSAKDVNDLQMFLEEVGLNRKK